MTGRVLVLLGLSAVWLSACADGTRGWVLRERATAGAGAAGETSFPEAGAAGEDTHVGDGGDAGAGGERTGTGGARCPTRFESACSPEVLLDNKDAAGSGQLFAEAIPDLPDTLNCVTRDVCDMLFRKTSEVRALVRINVIVENYEGVSETWSTGGESTIHISSKHLQDVADGQGDVRLELDNILYYHATNDYQNDDGNGVDNAWLVQGVANFVRYQAGLVPDSSRKLGGKYDDGGETTGFFFVWLDSEYPDFVYTLNQSLDPNDPVVWTTQAFQDITGRTVDELWTSYQASF